MIQRYSKEPLWGTYVFGQYYFRIQTDKLRSEVGLSDAQPELTSEQQRKLQREHLPAILHEYVHYLHEVSTQVGVVGLGMDITLRSLFSHWIDLGPIKAESRGTTSSEYLNKFGQARITKDIIDGDREDVLEGRGRLVNVTGINYQVETILIPSEEGYEEILLETPVVHFDSLVGSIKKVVKLKLGKYFLYEGLAYELDQLVEQKLQGVPQSKDKQRVSEYTVMREIARHIFPTVETKTFLSVGSMALQHVDCGRTFIAMIESVRQQAERGIAQTEAVNFLKTDVSRLLADKRVYFMEAQEEYHDAYSGRGGLYQAMGYLTTQTKQLYNRRIENPCFEVELIYDGNLDALLKTVQVCD